jgi:serine protease Do
MGSATSLNNGFLVSASHVFSSSGPILLMAKYDSEAYPAILVASNPITDIAILKFNKGIGLPHVVIKDLSDVSIGDKGFLVGSCMGLVDFEVLPVRISAFIFQSRNPNYPWVKTIVVSSDKAICPGYSGGGLFSDKGELIGVTSQAGVLNMREVFLGYIIPLPIEFKQPLK